MTHEQTKFIAHVFGAIGIGILGFSLVEPMVRKQDLDWYALLWGCAALVIFFSCYHILGQLEDDDDVST